MTLHVLATGTLLADPVARQGAKGQFATATIRVATDDGAVLVSAVAFGRLADDLLDRRAGDAVAIAGRARLTEWTGRDGTEHHGVSVVVEQLASAAAVRRADADRRSEAAKRGQHRGADEPADPGGMP